MRRFNRSLRNRPADESWIEIVKRIRALATRLLPVQVELDDISNATSTIITPEVIDAFGKCGGDFVEAVPFWYVFILIRVLHALKERGTAC